MSLGQLKHESPALPVASPNLDSGVLGTRGYLAVGSKNISPNSSNSESLAPVYAVLCVGARVIDCMAPAMSPSFPPCLVTTLSHAKTCPLPRCRRSPQRGWDGVDAFQ